MRQLEITIAGRNHVVACQAGQEDRLHELAGQLSERASELIATAGQLPDSKLFLLLSLMVMDEYLEEKTKTAQSFQRRKQEITASVEGDMELVAGKMTQLAERVNRLAERLAA
ncbi:MAG: cell division protein ZapA [Alphaproteobacteria bacterium]|nr:cell division protein ZapA [Thalassospira sp.]MCE2964420.1 cell division protein ZapA [Alphaproteobacteria bacterium]